MTTIKTINTTIIITNYYYYVYVTYCYYYSYSQLLPVYAVRQCTSFNRVITNRYMWHVTYDLWFRIHDMSYMS